MAIVLIVDDEKDFRDLMAEMVSRLGHEAVSVADGQTSLKLLKKQSFDVALVDFQMPGMSGVELLKKIKNFDDKIAVIIITGLDSEQVAATALSEGAEELIIKPIDIDKFEATINRVLLKAKSLD